MNAVKVQKILELKSQGFTAIQIRKEVKCSICTVYEVTEGKKYTKPKTSIRVRGLSNEETRVLACIAKNRDRSLNRLFLTYIRNGMGSEPDQNKVYED